MSDKIVTPINPVALDLSALVRELRTELTPPTVPAVYHDPDDRGSAHTVIRDGWKLVERKPLTRPAMRHAFEDLDSIAAWVKRRAPHAEDVDVLIAQDDDETPRAIVAVHVAPYAPNGDIVTAQVANHPTLLRWHAALGRGWMLQRELHTFLRSVKDTFRPVAASNGDVIGSQADQLIAALARIELSRSESFAVELAPNGMVKVASADAQNTLNVTLPEEFTVRVPWFLGVTGEATGVATEEPTKFYDLRIALQVDVKAATGGGKVPTFKLECLNLDEEYAFALADAAKHLQRRLGEPFVVLRGTAMTVEVAMSTARGTNGPGYCEGSYPRSRSNAGDLVGGLATFLQGLAKAAKADSPTLTPEQAADLGERGTVTPIEPDAGEVADD